MALGQHTQIISGYTLNKTEFDILNQGLDIYNQAYDWNVKSFPDVGYMHGATFGIRRKWSSGFIGFNWEQKLRSARAERTAAPRDIKERFSLSWTSLTVESAVSIGFFSIGAGIQGNKYTISIDASYNEEKERLSKQLIWSNIAFMEFAIGPKNNTQLTLKPFIEIPWKPVAYGSFSEFVGDDRTQSLEDQFFYGIKVILINGPK